MLGYGWNRGCLVNAPKLPPDYWSRIAALAFDMMTLDGRLSGREAYLLARNKVDEGLDQMRLELEPNFIEQ